MGNDMFNDEQLAHAKTMSEIRTHEQVIGIVGTLAMEAHNDAEQEREEYGTQTRQAMRWLEETDLALRFELATAMEYSKDKSDAVAWARHLSDLIRETIRECEGCDAEMRVVKALGRLAREAEVDE